MCKFETADNTTYHKIKTTTGIYILIKHISYPKVGNAVHSYNHENKYYGVTSYSFDTFISNTQYYPCYPYILDLKEPRFELTKEEFDMELTLKELVS